MKRKLSKTTLSIIVVLLATIIWGTYHFYSLLIGNNVVPKGKQEIYIHIPTGSTFKEVLSILSDSGLVDDSKAFGWMATQMKYDINVKPGRYKISSGMSSRQMVMVLRSGKQSPVKLKFHNVRNARQLAGVISKQIEADSIEIVSVLEDEAYLSNIGLNKHTAATIFIPNTYEFYWNTNATQFVEKMLKEHNKFWNDKRMAKAKSIGLTPAQVSTLASIVEKETARNDEKPTVAGVYMNRLKENWKLEADPTLIFAANDFTIRRVLNKHKEIDSPDTTISLLHIRSTWRTLEGSKTSWIAGR